MKNSQYPSSSFCATGNFADVKCALSLLHWSLGLCLGDQQLPLSLPVETTASDRYSYTGHVCQSLALGHYGSPSAVIASVLDGVESEGIRLEEVTSLSVLINGFGKKEKESLREMCS